MYKPAVEFSYDEEADRIFLRRISPQTLRRFNKATLEYLPILFNQVAKDMINKRAKNHENKKDITRLYTTLIEAGYFTLKPERKAAYDQLHNNHSK